MIAQHDFHHERQIFQIIRSTVLNNEKNNPSYGE